MEHVHFLFLADGVGEGSDDGVGGWVKRRKYTSVNLPTFAMFSVIFLVMVIVVMMMMIITRKGWMKAAFPQQNSLSLFKLYVWEFYDISWQVLAGRVRK